MTDAPFTLEPSDAPGRPATEPPAKPKRKPVAPVQLTPRPFMYDTLTHPGGLGRALVLDFVRRED